MVCEKCGLEHLNMIFKDVCAHFQATLVEFDGKTDHVYLLIEYPPKVAISRLVNSLKGVSLRLIRKNDSPSIRNALWEKSLWFPSDFAGASGGAPLTVIKQYIEQPSFSQNLTKRLISQP